MKNRDRLIMALDVSTLKEAERLVRQLSPLVKFFKVGKELFTSVGPKAVQMVRAHKAEVFLDLKFHDIPNTAGAACAEAARLKVSLLSVHALGGKEMLVRAARSVRQAAGREGAARPRVLAVTILTSMTERDLKEIGINKRLGKAVEDLARLAQHCGLDGVIASGHEIKRIRKVVKNNFLIVTPGVRPAWAARGDQKRIMTPGEALEAGADYLVIGRPITRSDRPREAAEKVLKEMGRVYG